MLGPLARLLRDQRRADIAIAELGADHLGRLVLLEVGDAGELRSQRRARWRGLADFRTIELAPLAASGGGKARSRDVARADLPALDFVGGEQASSAPALQGRGELPR